MYRLDNRVALVSGAGSVAAGIGNGRAIAILLARSGARIVAVDASLEAAAETCRERSMVRSSEAGAKKISSGNAIGRHLRAGVVVRIEGDALHAARIGHV